MTEDREPNIVNSGKSRKLTIDGHVFRIEIYRLETEQAWTLEVVDQEGTSHVWNEPFVTDTEALNTARQTIEEEGVKAFRRGNNVIPFRQH